MTERPPLRISSQMTALFLGIVFTGCGASEGCALAGCLLVFGIGDGEDELDSFEVTSPEDGEAVEGLLTFTFAYEVSPDDTGVRAELSVDGEGVAGGDAALPLMWTPAHDSGDLVVDVVGYIPGVGNTGEIERLQLTLDWSAPWQASMHQCVGVSCTAVPVPLVVDAPVRFWARPAFDVARTVRAEYRIDDVVVATRTEAPFWIDLDGSIAPAGAHTLDATVRRDDGEDATATAEITTSGITP